MTEATSRAALVTGAASGLGEAIAIGLATRGWRVGVADIDAAGARRVAGACSAAGGEGHAIVVDLLAADGAERMVADAIAAFATLDALVNNAGYGTGEAFLAMTAATW